MLGQGRHLRDHSCRLSRLVGSEKHFRTMIAIPWDIVCDVCASTRPEAVPHSSTFAAPLAPFFPVMSDACACVRARAAKLAPWLLPRLFLILGLRLRPQVLRFATYSWARQRRLPFSSSPMSASFATVWVLTRPLQQRQQQQQRT